VTTTATIYKQQILDMADGQIFRYNDYLYRLIELVLDSEDRLTHANVGRIATLRYGAFYYDGDVVTQFNPYAHGECLGIVK